MAHDDFVLLTHVHPDGDALGSTLGMAAVLRAMGKSVIVAHEEEMPERFSFLPGIGEVLRIEDVKRRFRVAVSLDCADRKRLGKAVQLLEPEMELLNIDHHVTNDRFGTCNLVDPEASATCQIVCELARLLSVPLQGDVATCLYTGLFTDTGGFRYSNTTAGVLRLAADMIEQGLNPYPIVERAVEMVTKPQLRLLAGALAGLQTAAGGQVAYISVSREMLQQAGATVEDTQELVNYPRNLEGVEVGVMFREEDAGQIKVSLRSKYRIDVSRIASRFGGGGHPRAAGCTVDGSLDEVVKQVLDAVAAELGRG
jgi:phosphoesterase RecJ-like protein